MNIPRIFHRIWLGSKPLPTEFELFGETWRRCHPEWEMKLWTDANLPRLVNEDVFGSAPSFAAKADILRYEVLSQFGGVYIDTDFECLRCIEPLVDSVDCFVAQQKDLDADFGRFCYVNNALIGAVPGHSFLGDLVGLVRQNINGLPTDMPASFLTGPHFMTWVLQAHPEVCIFPAKLFYPYTATERWRRNEAFPDAYAVHHWTLSDTSISRIQSRPIGDSNSHCLSVAIMPVKDEAKIRLKWVLEGLCLQTTANFEVLLVLEYEDEATKRLCSQFRGRLNLRSVLTGEVVGCTRAAMRNSALRAADAPRVLFLDGDCLPDPDVIETHARQGGRSALLFGFRRIYPVEKFFDFRDAVDFTGLFQHCRSEITGAYIAPSADRWRDVTPSCFSVPTEFARRVGSFNSTLREGDVSEFAERINQLGCPTAPCIYGARVTLLGPQSSPSRGNPTSIQPGPTVRLRFNQTIARIRRRGTASGRGIDGRSPYVIRIAGLAGVRDQSISALVYNLLDEFSTASAPTDAVSRVADRVGGTEKKSSIMGLCFSYVDQFVATGVLVPDLACPASPDGREKLRTSTGSVRWSVS